jgi:hypothetical protein
MRVSDERYRAESRQRAEESQQTFIANLRTKRAQLAAGMTEEQIDAKNDRRVLAQAAERRRQVAGWVTATEHHRAPALDKSLEARARTSPRRGASREQRPQGRRTRASL